MGPAAVPRFGTVRETADAFRASNIWPSPANHLSLGLRVVADYTSRHVVWEEVDTSDGCSPAFLPLTEGYRDSAFFHMISDGRELVEYSAD